MGEVIWKWKAPIPSKGPCKPRGTSKCPKCREDECGDERADHSCCSLSWSSRCKKDLDDWILGRTRQGKFDVTDSEEDCNGESHGESPTDDECYHHASRNDSCRVPDLFACFSGVSDSFEMKSLVPARTHMTCAINSWIYTILVNKWDCDNFPRRLTNEGPGWGQQAEEPRYPIAVPSTTIFEVCKNEAGGTLWREIDQRNQEDKEEAYVEDKRSRFDMRKDSCTENIH